MWRNSSCFKLLAPKLLNPHWIRLLLCNFKTCDMFDEDLQVIQPEPSGPCAKGRPLGKLISTVHLPTSQHNQDANSASRGLKLWNAKFESADDRSAEDSQEVHMQCIHRCVWFPCYCSGWVAENVHQGPCGSKNCSFAHWQNSQFAHRAKIIQLTHTHTFIAFQWSVRPYKYLRCYFLESHLKDTLQEDTDPPEVSSTNFHIADPGPALSTLSLSGSLDISCTIDTIWTPTF